MSKNDLVIYLAGHGGFDPRRNPKYSTGPDKMFYHEGGGRYHDTITQLGKEYSVFYEGFFNRQVVDRCVTRTKELGINATSIHDPYRDMPLIDRANYVNRLSKVYNTILIEIHANAGGGTGVEIFTTRGETQSDSLASMFISNWQLITDDSMRIRSDFSDGDVDKESNFYVITKTICPAVLFEAGFFDNKHDADILVDTDYHDQIGRVSALTAAQFFNS